MPRPELNRYLRAFAPQESIRRLFVPPASTFLPVDGLRALSILWVMLMHTVWFQTPLMTPESALSFLDRAPRWIVAGHYGVDVFFVISGFLIGLMLMREHNARGFIDVRRFYARRFLRLMPAYFLALAIYCVAIGVNCDMIWSNLVYVNNFVPVTRQAMPWAWSLAIEEQFYLAFPLFLMFVFYRLRRRHIGLLCFLLALGVLIRGWVVVHWGIHAPVSLALGADDAGLVAWAGQLYMKPHTRYGGLLCGVIAAVLYLKAGTASFFAGHRTLAGVGLTLSLVDVGLVAMAPVHVSSSRWSSAASVLFLSIDHYAISIGVAYVLLYSLYPTGRLARATCRFLSLRLWYPVAQLSYSAYLLHPIVLGRLYAFTASRGLLSLPEEVFYLVGPGLSLIAAAVLYVFVEKPFMNLRELRTEGALERSRPAMV